MWILCLVYPTVTIIFCLGYKEWVFSKDLADPSFLIDLTTVVQIGTTAEAVLLSPRPRWPNSLLSKDREGLFSQNVPKAADITFFLLCFPLLTRFAAFLLLPLSLASRSPLAFCPRRRWPWLIPPGWTWASSSESPRTPPTHRPRLPGQSRRNPGKNEWKLMKWVFFLSLRLINYIILLSHDNYSQLCRLFT